MKAVGFGQEIHVLEIDRLSKHYGRTKAVSGLTLRVRSGEVLALLGPNGAGKTTTIRCAVGLTSPDSGRIRVNGFDLQREAQQAKRQIGFVPDRAWFYPKVTARELLRYITSVRKTPDAGSRIEALLERFRLAQHADTLTESYSHGMRQRLAFCVALVDQPRLFISDEPMVGLDVQGHRDVKLLFRELAAAGCAAILTTHTLSVAEEIADRIALIDHGRLIALGTMDELRASTRQAGASLEDLFLHLTGNETQPEKVEAGA
jgi:ABC-2 type transport system ATP-binding protein